MASEPLITLERVAVRLAGRRVLEDISWQIRRGENWVIQGPNGAGKSTLARTLLGRTAVVAGCVQRHDPAAAAEGTPAAALVSAEQYHHLYAREQFRAQMRSFSGRVHEVTPAGRALGLSDGDNAALPDGPDGISRPETAALAAKPLEALSSGELRKLLIIRALAGRPRLLILDEPFDGLDAGTRRQLGRMLQRLHDDGLQMVLITHRNSDIPDFFTHAIVLDQGRAVDQGPLADVRRRLAKGDAADPAVRSSRRPCPPPAMPFPPQDRPLGEPHPDGSEELIGMQDVTVRYGETIVLDRVNWRVRGGENWALTGPNGAGKTTLLKLITGENLQGYANRLTLFGQPKGSGESLRQIRQRLGYVADDLQARYQRELTGLEVVCSGFFDSVGLYERVGEEQRRIALDWMQRLDLAELAGRAMTRLSFGQQRQLLIARAMVKQPRLLILDEPCNGLDAGHRGRLLAMLDRIAAGNRTNLLVVTHRDGEMPRCITHCLRLAAGRVVANKRVKGARVQGFKGRQDVGRE